MTEKKKHFVSLSVKPLFVLLLGLVLGVCVCLLANFTGEQIIERSYMSDKAVLKRTNRAAQEFQSFVRQNSISTRDTDMLARWGESRKNYYIMLYHDQRQILEIGWWGADSAAVDAYSLKEQMASVVYPIVFRDGTFYAVIYDNSDSGLYDLLWIVSLLLGCAVLALTLLAYNRRIARRVVAISQEVQSIGAGNLYLQLEPKGRDEISQLTASVEQMRLSLLRKTSEEQRALQQNTQKTIALSVNVGKGAARLTEQALQKAIKKFLEQKSKAPHGKQTMRQLMKQNAGVSNIEITDSNIKAFESTAKKYNIDFSLKKVKGEQTRYLVFFKGRDADVMTAAFQEFSAKKLNRDKKPSIRKALAAAKDKAKQLNAARDKVKKIDRGREI